MLFGRESAPAAASCRTSMTTTAGVHTSTHTPHPFALNTCAEQLMNVALDELVCFRNNPPNESCWLNMIGAQALVVVVVFTLVSTHNELCVCYKYAPLQGANGSNDTGKRARQTTRASRRQITRHHAFVLPRRKMT